MKVSIIIPCYNQGHFLTDAIKSAFEQTHEEKEIIVVNDGSTDETERIIKHFEQRKTSSRAEFISITQENKGLSAARNAGIRKATGEYIVCLDADDKLDPSYIKRTIGISDIVCTGTQEFGNRNRKWKTPLVIVRYKDLLVKNRLNYAAIFKRSIWETVGGFDENMRLGFEDYRFWLDASKIGYKIRVINEFLLYYRKHDKSMFSEAVKNREQIIKYMKQFHKLL